LNAAVTQVFDAGDDDEQAKAEQWARWQGRRQKKIQKRAGWKHKFNTMTGEHNLGICSSDCAQCKAIEK